MSNLEKAQRFADAGAHEASIARSLIVIAAALKMQVEPQIEKEQAFAPLLNGEEAARLHDDWCEDPNCPTVGRRGDSTNTILKHKDWCQDPTCSNGAAHG